MKWTNLSGGLISASLVEGVSDSILSVLTPLSSAFIIGIHDLLIKKRGFSEFGNFAVPDSMLDRLCQAFCMH